MFLLSQVYWFSQQVTSNKQIHMCYIHNSALPKHHVNCWSLTSIQLSAYCLILIFPTSLYDFLAFKMEFN